MEYCNTFDKFKPLNELRLEGIILTSMKVKINAYLSLGVAP